ncbi:MAG TPA: tetratricopeptide repeat protein, partial [Clostridia bacterium]|nr:tetratricopeptide repeat protein [Clostridia bacterium]
MDIKKIFKTWLLSYIFIGIVLGLIFALFRIKLSASSRPIVFVILCVLISSFTYYKLLNPVRLLVKGNFDEAISKFNKLAEKYCNNASLKNVQLYNIACCYNRMGKFEESIDALNKIDSTKLGKNLSGAYYALFSSNLILLERDLELAEQYIDKSYVLLNKSCILLFKGYIEVLKGNRVKADDSIQGYFKTTKNTKIKWGFS